MLTPLLATAKPMSGTEPWLQYGSFGVLVLIMFWGMWKGIPKILDIHEKSIAKVADASKAANDKLANDNKEAIERLAAAQKEAIERLATDHKDAMVKIVCAFEADGVACRNERLEMVKLAAAEREKDRVAQERLAEHFEKVMLKSSLTAST